MKRILETFRKLSFRSRILLASGVFALVISVLALTALWYAIQFTESHLVSEDHYYELRNLIENNIERGTQPSLPKITSVYAEPAEVNGVKLDPIPPRLAKAPEGYSEYVKSDRASYVYKMTHKGVTYVLEEDQTEFEELEQRLFFGFAGFSLLVVFISCVLGWAVGETVVRPVKRLAAEVKRSAESPHFTPLAIEPNKDEVGFLAKTCEESLKRMHETLERERLFASDISHEFRTRLAVIATTAELLEDVGNLSEEDRKRVKKIDSAATRMDRLIRVLLALARGEKVNQADSVLVPLSRVAGTVITEESSDAELRSIRVILDDQTQGKAPLVHFEFASCVLANLLRNAIRYSDRGGAITVSLAPNGFSVRDEGCGIPKEEIGKLFLPFQRGAHSRGKGNGIGLSLVSRICEREGWKIGVESEVGKGAVFRISFPE